MSNHLFITHSSRWLAALFFVLCTATAAAQTTQFTYQGLLNDGSSPANGAYDLQFRLFDAAAGGNQVGSTLIREDVAVSNGLFKVTLDFGAAVFPGAPRFLEIGVRPGASSGAFTALAPLQPLTSTPYALRSLSAASADTATNATNATTATNATNAATATNALQLGGQAASQYVLSSDARLSDARPPTAGSGNYIQNTSSPQPANFNISGNGTAGGTLTANQVNVATQYNLGGARVLFAAGFNNVFTGIGAGAGNTTGNGNSFFGGEAGRSNTTGDNNSFFGRSAGITNTTGFNNTFVGSGAGSRSETASYNSFFGHNAGFNTTTGANNTFFGDNAGFYNVTGGGNAFFGNLAGEQNTANNNTFLGAYAGRLNTTGTDNTFVGAGAGHNAGTGYQNSFFGVGAGNQNTGYSNSFFGHNAGSGNTAGFHNTLVGWHAGDANVTGNNLTILGDNADVGAPGLTYATAIGADAVVSASNTIVLGRANGADRVVLPGLGSAGAAALCRNAALEISSCSSSRRYKDQIRSFRDGLQVVLRLQPASFQWKDSGARDLGLIAEELAMVEPLLVTHNDQGEVEGVKYDQLNVVLINAIKQQQQQIELQQAEIAQLKKLVCGLRPSASICQARKRQ